MKAGKLLQRRLAGYCLTLLMSLGPSAGPLEARARPCCSVNRYEQTAIEVVNGFNAALANGDVSDVDKAMAYIDDDIRFLVETKEPLHGKGEFRRLVSKLQPMIHEIKILRSRAIGNSKEVMVINERIDVVTINGKSHSLTFGAFYRVNPQTRKIEEWLELDEEWISGLPPGAAPQPAPKQ